MPHLAVNGALLHFEMRGTGRPIVLVHGLGADMHVWDAEVAHLRGRHTVLAYDARGHGLSSSAPSRSLDEHVRDLKCLLECLGLEFVTLVGIAMDCDIARAFAVRYPEHVVELVLVAAECDEPECI